VKAILKSVSRSFYLTIQFLPRPLRDPVSLAYLLARATDTVADTAGISTAQRLMTLRALARVIAGELEFAELKDSLGEFAAQQNDPRERHLIENLRGIFEWLARIDPQDRGEIREVLATIVKGQELDLERFADPKRITSLRTAAELDEYTYLVAGCVGRFWTRLGFQHFPKFGNRAPNEMTELGVEYGKGLQLINVLRDRPADLGNGRDYLPSDEVAAASAEEVIQQWLERAEKGISAGIDYSASLTNWRIRYATALPALIGARTIALLRRSKTATEKVKVPRWEIRRILRASAFAALSPFALRALFQRLLAAPSRGGVGRVTL
jgi:farnesyl-diphosphate farnesyltransferase